MGIRTYRGRVRKINFLKQYLVLENIEGDWKIYYDPNQVVTQSFRNAIFHKDLVEIQVDEDKLVEFKVV